VFRRMRKIHALKLLPARRMRIREAPLEMSPAPGPPHRWRCGEPEGHVVERRKQRQRQVLKRRGLGPALRAFRFHGNRIVTTVLSHLLSEMRTGIGKFILMRFRE
jgi:hypothetical protein